MRGLILGLAVGLAVLLTAGEGRAAYFDGQKLNELCNDDDYSSASYCLGYILGVYDAGIEVLGSGTNKRQWRNKVRAACVPKGVSGRQLQEVVKKWLREHPADWHYEASGRVLEAFEEAFPCP